MQFLFQPLTWGFLLVLLPPLIHLINMMRHRRTQWAAMDFLLESYRKHRRWVWLKQAMLLASRMLIVALAVAMLAQWVSGSRWLSFVSQSVTHHYFVLDDSASMGDTGSGGSAYQSAIGAIQTVLGDVNSREGSHVVTVLRASRAAIAGNGAASGSTVDNEGDANESNDSPVDVTADSVADLYARSVPSDPSGLLTKLLSTQPSSVEAPLKDAIEVVRPALSASVGEKAVVYLLSDFRKKDWVNNSLLQQQLQSVSSSNVDLQLIDCASVQHENLSVVSVSPQQEVLVAGVPALINVSVRNHGTSPARNVTVRVNAVDYSDTNLEQKPGANYSGLSTELPPLLIERIEPGETITRHTQVLFPRSGSHVVEALLPPDPLLADNKGHCVLDLQDGVRVLLIDGDAAGKHSFFFESALDPGGSSKTGLLMTREGPEFLRDVEPSALDGYACVVMQAVDGLDERAIANLHGYVARGGGLAVFFGELMTDADYARYNAGFAAIPNGALVQAPLMPFKLKGMIELERTPDENAPDVVAEPHPIFAPLLGLSNSPFQFVRMNRYVGIDRSLFADSESVRSTHDEARSSSPSEPSTVLSLRNQDPVLLDYSLGNGRVLYAMTALDRQWTNWAQDPTFVVAALRMVGYLSSFRGLETSKVAGTPMSWTFASEEMLPEVQVVAPSQIGGTIRPVLTLNAAPTGEASLVASLQAQAGESTEEYTRSALSAGVFEWWGMSTQGTRVVRNMARDVSTVEGELEKVANADLSRELAGIAYSYKTAESIGNSTSLAGLANRNMLLMVLLLLFLIFEQWLAWNASYHLPKK